jgi:hypothetical protein
MNPNIVTNTNIIEFPVKADEIQQCVDVSLGHIKTLHRLHLVSVSSLKHKILMSGNTEPFTTCIKRVCDVSNMFDET